jgi:metal transporter CNNM
LYIAICIALVLFGGVCSGITVGLFSLDATRLQVTARTGTAFQRTSARRLLFFVRNAHWSLVVLLLGATAATTALPIFLDRLVDALAAIIISITAVLFFGEIVPQAVFVRHNFLICSLFVPLLYVMFAVCSIVAWPVAKFLDWLVGHEEQAIGRDELETHFRLAEQVKDADAIAADGKGCGLWPQEIRIMRGALALSQRKVRSLQGVSVDDAFCVSSNDALTPDLVRSIVSSGFSRVPVYFGNNRSHIIGVLLIKSLLPLAFTCPATPPRVGDLQLRELPRVADDSIVQDLYLTFKSGQSHMAAVCDKRGQLVKFVTLEDVIRLVHDGATVPPEDVAAPANGAAAAREVALLNAYESVRASERHHSPHSTRNTGAGPSGPSRFL